MEELKFLVVMFVNLCFIIAIGLSVLQIKQFVLAYCVLQSIILMVNVLIGIYFALGISPFR